MLNGLEMTGYYDYNHELAISECYLGKGSTLKSLDLKVCGDGVLVGSESEFKVIIKNGNNVECETTIKGKTVIVKFIIISELEMKNLQVFYQFINYLIIGSD